MAENRDALAERRMVRRVFIAMAIVTPICVVFFGLMLLMAARIGGVPTGAPVLMGVGIGVLAGVFFGMWAGVVASVHDLEALELAEVPTTEVGEGGDDACWAHLVCPECGAVTSEGHRADCSQPSALS